MLTCTKKVGSWTKKSEPHIRGPVPKRLGATSSSHLGISSLIRFVAASGTITTILRGSSTSEDFESYIVMVDIDIAVVLDPDDMYRRDRQYHSPPPPRTALSFTRYPSPSFFPPRWRFLSRAIVRVRRRKAESYFHTTRPTADTWIRSSSSLETGC